MVVQYNTAVVGARTIKAVMEALEYTVELWDRGSGAAAASHDSGGESTRFRREFLVSLLLVGPLVTLNLIPKP